MGRLGFHLNVVLLLYIAVTMHCFNKVFRTTMMVIDEEFHLRQGMHYCKGHFSIWDDKITTFPGLYLVSTALFMPLKACSIYNLRLTSLIASVVNLMLIYKIRDHLNRQSKIIRSNWFVAFESLTIAILPPMYFFSFLYYTDVISITFVLAMVLLSMKNCQLLSSLFGLGAVLMRQTNIVWVGVIFGHKALDILMSRRTQNVSGHLQYPDMFKCLVSWIGDSFANPIAAVKDLCHVIKSLWGFVAVLLSFIAFVVENGSIVVGDKSAHEARLHLPQIGYFTLFTSLFGLQHSLTNIGPVLDGLLRHWKRSLIVIAAIIVAVHFNTIVHPYLLADNRHYVFYIWNRFYGKHIVAKYLAVPAYLVGLALLQHQLTGLSSTFGSFFVIGLFFTVALQQLIEFRYFLIPFILLRLLSTNGNSIRKQDSYLLLEFCFYSMVNAFSFYVFFNKEIQWPDYNEPQRLIW